MCGICGIIDNSRVDREILFNMTKSLVHRGPDSLNIEILGNIGLCHARLSIIDLSDAGKQPMCNEDRTIWLTYNGEFYTFKDFKKELIRKGHVFKSNTDTEVIIHLYEEYGLTFIEKLRGMFAFAIYDIKKSRLILVRDRVGIKPLYYYYDGKKLIFGSEIKAILKYPQIEIEFDNKALTTFFTFGYIPGDLSIYNKIRKLKPGHFLIYENNEIKLEKYWSLENKQIEISEADSMKQLDHLLNEVVKMRMISDVPLGVLLSGGLDSSLVAAIMAKHSNKPIKTFSISFNEDGYNEIEHARKVANHIRSEHHEFNVKLNDAYVLEDLMYYYDEPFADSSCIPTYYVSKIARDHVTVVLSGDGGDELFGGYNWYDWMLKLDKFKLGPLQFRNIIARTASKFSMAFPGKHFLSTLNLSEFDAFIERTTFFSRIDAQLLLGEFFDDNYLENYRDLFNSKANTLLQKLTLTDFHHYLPDDILVKVDRASMAVSLEARVPLLDHKLVEFAFSLQDDFKIHLSDKKYLLKKIARKYLPEDFNYKRKQGFSIPQELWLKNKYSAVILDLISNGGGLFNKKFILELIKRFDAGDKRLSKILWPLLVFLLWEKKAMT